MIVSRQSTVGFQVGGSVHNRGRGNGEGDSIRIQETADVGFKNY